MAPRVFDTDRVAAYNTDHRDQWSGGHIPDDGLYHPERYNKADDSLSKASQQGTPRQDSPSGPKGDEYQQNKHGQQYSPPHQTQGPGGGYYLPNSKVNEEQRGSSNTFSNGVSNQSFSSDAQQEKSNKNTSGDLSNNTAAQGEPDSNALLSTATGTGTPTISPTSTSTTSPTSSPEPKHDEVASYQSATTALSAGLGVILLGVVFASWLHRRRRQQKGEPKQHKKITGAKVPRAFKNAMGFFFSSKSTVLPSKSIPPLTKSILLPPGSISPSTDMIVHSKSDEECSTKKVTLSPKSGMESTKKRVSSLYSSFVGAVVGTGVAAVGAVRKLRTPKPQDDRGHGSNDVDKDDFQDSDVTPRDSSEEEKGNINYSTPTLVDSPTEEQPPALRRVPSGQHQVKEQLDTETKAATIPEHDEEEPERSAAHNTGDRAAKSERKTTSSLTDNSKGISRDNSFTSKGLSLQAIPEVPPFTDQFRVEIEYSAKKTGELNVREGQTVSIRQTFDDGWALCVFDESGQKGLVPRAFLSQQPIEPTSLKKLPSNSQSSTSLASVPGSPRFYSKFGASRNFS